MLSAVCPTKTIYNANKTCDDTAYYILFLKSNNDKLNNNVTQDRFLYFSDMQICIIIAYHFYKVDLKILYEVN